MYYIYAVTPVTQINIKYVNARDEYVQCIQSTREHNRQLMMQI